MSKNKYILGIDPGSKSGAAAVVYVDEDGALRGEAEDLPTISKFGRSRVSPVGFNQWLQSLSFFPTEAWIEDVHAMPRDSAKGAFAFGHSVGSIEGIIAALSIPYQFVAPSKWQKSVLTRTVGKNHEFIRSFACGLFPDVDLRYKKDHNKASALLIAYYGLNRDRKND